MLKREILILIDYQLIKNYFIISFSIFFSIYFRYSFNIFFSYFYLYIFLKYIHPLEFIFFRISNASYQLRILILILDEMFRQCSCMYQKIISYYSKRAYVYILYRVFSNCNMRVIGNIERNILCSTNRCPILFSFYGYKNIDFGQ